MDKALHWNIGSHKGDKSHVMATLNQGMDIPNLMEASSQWEGKMMQKQFATLAKVKTAVLLLKCSEGNLRQ